MNKQNEFYYNETDYKFYILDIETSTIIQAYDDKDDCKFFINDLIGYELSREEQKEMKNNFKIISKKSILNLN
tara:strand:+ start:389 stop:607 length:219 start_codon:yes stop_codon:yes gene_type:complete